MQPNITGCYDVCFGQIKMVKMFRPLLSSNPIARVNPVNCGDAMDRSYAVLSNPTESSISPVSVCIHTYTHAYIHTYRYTYIHIYIPTYIHTNIHKYIHSTYIHT